VPLEEDEAQGEAEKEWVGEREMAPLALAEGQADKLSENEDEKELEAVPGPVAVTQWVRRAVGLLLRVRWALLVPQELRVGDWLGKALASEEKETELDAEGDWLPLGESELLLQSVYKEVTDKATVRDALAVSERGFVLLSALEAVDDWDAEAQADAVGVPCQPPRPPPLVRLGVPVPHPLEVVLGESELLDTELCKADGVV
jgi:hypothetical protein